MELAQGRGSPSLRTTNNRPGLFPNLPKAQHLPSGRDDSGPLRVLGEVEDSLGVPSEISDFSHGGVTPDRNLDGRGEDNDWEGKGI